MITRIYSNESGYIDDKLQSERFLSHGLRNLLLSRLRNSTECSVAYVSGVMESTLYHLPYVQN